VQLYFKLQKNTTSEKNEIVVSSYNWYMFVDNINNKIKYSIIITTSPRECPRIIWLPICKL